MQLDEYYTTSARVCPGLLIDNLCRIPDVKDVQDVKVKSYTIHEVVEEYFQKTSRVAPKLEGHTYSDHLYPYSFSTVPGTNYKF